jgi:hypothetical protein
MPSGCVRRALHPMRSELDPIANRPWQFFEKPFKIDESILKLLRCMSITLQLVLNIYSSGHDGLTDVQQSGCVTMMHQLSECATFANTYVRQTYCTYPIML